MAWWKGDGSAIDFFNPKATTWWHVQQDHVLDMGIDGWKLDFGDSYLKKPPNKRRTARWRIRSIRKPIIATFGPTASRSVVLICHDGCPYDKSYGFEGRFYARPEHAPVTWVGDNRRDWVGFIDALDEIFDRPTRAMS